MKFTNFLNKNPSELHHHHEIERKLYKMSKNSFKLCKKSGKINTEEDYGFSNPNNLRLSSTYEKFLMTPNSFS